MPAEATFPTALLLAFALVLARVAGVLALAPLPGLSAAPGAAKAVLAVAITLALYDRWPAAPAVTATPGALAAAMVAEAAIGLALGICVVLVLEAMAIAAQVLGMPAGFGYASTIDPNTQADSGVLVVVMAQVFSGLMFFALGLDRQILRLLAESLERVPAAGFTMGPPAAALVIGLGGEMLSVGLRLALPVVAVLVMLDVSLALAGKLNSQLQLLSLAFPAKMMAALVVLTWVAGSFPRVLAAFGAHAGLVARRVLGI